MTNFSSADDDRTYKNYKSQSVAIFASTLSTFVATNNKVQNCNFNFLQKENEKERVLHLHYYTTTNYYVILLHLCFSFFFESDTLGH